MQSKGNKKFNIKLANLYFLILSTQHKEATNVGSPIVKMPKPNTVLTTNTATMANIEAGKLSIAPISGKIKFIPEKKNVCEPRTKFNFKSDTSPKITPNKLSTTNFLNKLFISNPKSLYPYKSQPHLLDRVPIFLLLSYSLHILFSNLGMLINRFLQSQMVSNSASHVLSSKAQLSSSS
jgi:hypothetical protein